MAARMRRRMARRGSNWRTRCRTKNPSPTPPRSGEGRPRAIMATVLIVGPTLRVGNPHAERGDYYGERPPRSVPNGRLSPLRGEAGEGETKKPTRGSGGLLRVPVIPRVRSE